MQMTSAHWEDLRAHASTSETTAPERVFTTLAALIDPSRIVASFARFDRSEPTVWKVWAVTDNSLAYVEISFESDNYDRSEEQDRPNRAFETETTVRVAVANLLSSAIEYSISTVGPLIDVATLGRQAWAPTSATVKFANGSSVDLPDQSTITRHVDRVRSDELIAAVRRFLD